MRILNWLMTALLIVMTAIVTYWAQERRAPVVQLEETVDTPLVQQGGLLRVRYVIHREKICHVFLQQILFDSMKSRFPVPTQEYHAAPGEVGHEEFASVVTIPSGFAPGRGRYRAIRSYYCNPLHSWLDWPIVVVSPDVEFEVVDQSIGVP